MTFRANLLSVLLLVTIWTVAESHRCTFRVAGSRTKFIKSSTTFTIFNTFATVTTQLDVETTLPHLCYGWRKKSRWCKWAKKYGKVRRNVQFFLPAGAVVSKLELILSDGTTEPGVIMTTDAAKQLFHQYNLGSKALLLSRWTNEQFKLVSLKTKLKYAQVASVIIEWRYLIPLEHNRYRIYFPVNMPASYENAIVEVSGTVSEALPINFFEVQSPDPGLYITTVTEPTPESRTVMFSGTFRDFKMWLYGVSGASTGKTTSTKGKSKKGKSSSSSSSGKKRYRWYPYQRHKKRRTTTLSPGEKIREAIGSSYQYDLVFSLVYNHTLPAGNPFFGEPAYLHTLGAPRAELFFNADLQCAIHGISIQDLIFQTAAEPIYPDIRRLTIFVDDISQIDAAYFLNIKAAIKEVVTFGSTQRRYPQLAIFQPNQVDGRLFIKFRLIVLLADGTITTFPSTAGTFADVDNVATNPGPTDVEDALLWIDNLPVMQQATPGFTFTETMNEFVNVLSEYRTGMAAQSVDITNEISDIFYLSNRKPVGTGGNFVRSERQKFVDAIEVEQAALRAVTGRPYGQPIFTFGFGPESDFNLLDAIAANNHGHTRMAFNTFTEDTIVQQINSFYLGIGRVIAGDIKVTQITLTYRDPNDFNTFADVLADDALFRAGFSIPILRDLEEVFNSFQTTKTIQNPNNPTGPMLELYSFAYEIDFLWARDFTRGSRQRTYIFSAIPHIDDILSVATKLDEQAALCAQADVVQVLIAEKGRRMRAKGVTNVATDAELTAMISEAGMRSSLQTTETSFYVDTLQEYSITSLGGAGASTTGSTTSAAAERCFYSVVAFVVALVLLY